LAQVEEREDQALRDRLRVLVLGEPFAEAELGLLPVLEVHERTAEEDRGGLVVGVRPFERLERGARAAEHPERDALLRGALLGGRVEARRQLLERLRVALGRQGELAEAA